MTSRKNAKGRERPRNFVPFRGLSRPGDFSRRRRFPGTQSSYSEQFNDFVVTLENLPRPVFALLLFLLALIPTRSEWRLTPVIWLFFLGDWVLLAALARAGKSFGPSKPPTLVLAVFRLIPAAFPLPWNLLLQFLGTLLVVYGFWIEPHRIHVTRQTLRSAKLKTRKPLRVLQLGDLHVERITRRERQLSELVRALAPDLILFTGDFLNTSYLKDPVTLEQARTILSEWRAPLGTFAVMGSPAVDKPENVARLLDGLEIRVLRNQTVTLDGDGDRIDLVGIDCTHKPFLDIAALDSCMNGRPEHFTILLYHSPDLAPEAARRGVDWQLSGHTHGGQVRLPFIGALYAGSLYGKRFEAGRYQLDGLTLYVARGIGMEGKAAPRVRFLCPPEIVLWEVGGP
ncbi:MAG: metallophosphoesterase [Chloroflexi bacterium]|nr:metallophosphoesterase [Chloroflexota bacterium]